MGRFYKTTSGRYMDDFLYQPPFKLAQQVLAAKEAEKANQVKQIMLLDNLPIDVWQEADGELASQIQNKYQQEAQGLVSKLKENIDSTEVNKRLAYLQNQIKKDYTDGDIAKIQQNAKNYRAFQSELEQLSNEDKAIYGNIPQAFLESRTDNGVNTFEYPTLYGKKDVMNEFLKSPEFKSLKKDMQITDKDVSNGSWIKLIRQKRGGIGLDKVQKAFKGWFEGNMQDYAKTRQFYSQDTPYAEKYFDDKDNLLYNDKNTTIGSLYSKLDAYTQKDNADLITKKSANPFAVKAYAQRISQGNDGLHPATAFSSTIRRFAPVSHEMQKAIGAYTSQAIQLISQTMKKAGKSSQEIVGIIERLKNVDDFTTVLSRWANATDNNGKLKYPNIAKRANALMSAFNTDLDAGSKHWTKWGLKDAQIKKLQANLDRFTKVMPQRPGLYAITVGDTDISLGENQNATSLQGKEVYVKDLSGNKVKGIITAVRPIGRPSVALGTFLDERNGTFSTAVTSPIEYEVSYEVPGKDKWSPSKTVKVKIYGEALYDGQEATSGIFVNTNK